MNKIFSYINKYTELNILELINMCVYRCPWSSTLSAELYTSTSKVLDKDNDILSLFTHFLGRRKHKDKLHTTCPHIELADHLLSPLTRGKTSNIFQGHLIHVLFTAVSLALRKAPGIDEIKGSYGWTKGGMSKYRKMILLMFSVTQRLETGGSHVNTRTSRHGCQIV